MSSLPKYGTMASASSNLVAGVQHPAETLDGLAQRLRALRQNKHPSQTDPGRLVALHDLRIGRFEGGASRPSDDNLRRPAHGLGVTGDSLLYGAANDGAKARFEGRELLRLFQEVEQLPDEANIPTGELLDAFFSASHCWPWPAGSCNEETP